MSWLAKRQLTGATNRYCSLHALDKNLVFSLDRFAKTADSCDSVDSILTQVYLYECIFVQPYWLHYPRRNPGMSIAVKLPVPYIMQWSAFCPYYKSPVLVGSSSLNLQRHIVCILEVAEARARYVVPTDEPFSQSPR